MKWTPEFATGIRNIDHQHQHVLQIITLYEKISDDKARRHEAHPLIRRTREFMEFHFSVEESLMRLLLYPDFESHRAEHQRELRQIAEIECRILRGDTHNSLAPLMRQCLFGHVVTDDKRLAQYALGLFGQRSPGKTKRSAAVAALRCG